MAFIIYLQEIKLKCDLNRMKRSAGSGQSLTKTEEKKARLEAGLQINVNQDFTSLQIENILKEVSLPSSLAQQVHNLQRLI